MEAATRGKNEVLALSSALMTRLGGPTNHRKQRSWHGGLSSSLLATSRNAIVIVFFYIINRETIFICPKCDSITVYSTISIKGNRPGN